MSDSMQIDGAGGDSSHLTRDAGDDEPPSKASEDADAAPRNSAQLDQELAALQAELAELEGTAPPHAAADTAHEEPEVSTPPPDEQQFEDDDGTIYVWDKNLRKFVPQAEPAAAGPVYEMADMTYVPEEEMVPSLAAVQEQQRLEQEAALQQEVAGGKKRPAPDPAAGGPEAGDPKKSKKEGKKGGGAQQEKQDSWFELKNNTSVYVDGLPDDVTAEELKEVFSKCGLIKEDEFGKPRIKLYMDKALGVPKGDALITFLKGPSVALAVQLLDGTPLRLGGPKPMAVSQAQFAMKGDKYKPKARPMKREAKKQLEKLEKRLNWGGFDDRAPAEKVTVVLHHMFRLEELEAPDFERELEEDIMSECSKIGAVEKVRIFNTNPGGVISVRFKEVEGANACVARMDGRWFGGQQIRAHMWDGVTNYQVKAKARDTEEDEAQRLEAFAKALES